jgi:hypothetical protein
MGVDEAPLLVRHERLEAGSIEGQGGWHAAIMRRARRGAHA